MSQTFAPSGFKVDAILCDSVATADGKLYIQGGGWNILPAQQFPYAKDRIGIASVISVPYTATNAMHELNIWLQDLDGKRYPLGVLQSADGTSQAQMSLTAKFNTGRPPILQAGEPQSVPFAINLDNMLFEVPGTYCFVMTIDTEELARLSFRVVTPQMIMIGGGM